MFPAALVELYLARAQIHLSCHRVMDAYEDSQRVKSICPDHPAVEQLLQSLGHLSTEQRKRAMQLALKGRLDESLIHLTLAIAANPLNPILYLERSVVHRRKGQYWKALDDLCRAVHFQSDSQSNKMEIMRTAQNQIFVTLIELVLQWYFDGQACIALYLIDNVIDAVPNYFLPYLIKADCYVQLNAKQNAVIHYERSLNCLKLTDPMLVRHTIVNRICQTRLSLALSAMTHLNWKGAEQELDHCVDYEPLVPEFHAFRGRVYYQLGKKEQAWQELLACCYLYISDWALNMRTSGRWSELPISVKDRLVVHLTRKLEWSAGSLISSFVAHPMALRELANGKCCVPVAQKINQFLRQYKSIGIERRNPWLSGCSRGKNLRDFLKAPWPRFEIESSRLSSLCSSRSSQSHSLIREKKQIKAQVEQIRAKRRG
ncbi:unnamed protein product [Echinostoma caproni]|uniref:TPR_REGION domain-containing protein n=1 Tax=Echinostoma caproni TaxID=27848 RepID=A0A183ACZ2_9TREM|nr:unnamed protein product [Echinostoma caproni]